MASRTGRAADVETLGIGVADDDGISVTTARMVQLRNVMIGRKSCLQDNFAPLVRVVGNQ